jgi:hypothetical protein
MADFQSFIDRYGDFWAKNLRKVGDFYLRNLGSRLLVIKIKRHVINEWAGNQGADVFGDYVKKADITKLSNVYIMYPFKKVEIFGNRINGIKIEGGIYPENSEGIEFLIQSDKEEDVSNIVEGDIFVDHFRTENNILIPFVLEVQRVYAEVSFKNIISRSGVCTFYLGSFDISLANKLDLYLDSIGMPDYRIKLSDLCKKG